MTHKISKYSDYALIILCIAVITIACLWNLCETYSIGIVPDEFGYWSAAAIYSGYDWSAAMTTTPYYSFFYGIILIPIFNIFIDNPVYMFRAAIVFNTIMLDACFFCAYSFFRRLNGGRNSIKKDIIAALLVSVYPAYLLFSKVTLSENILLLITWLIVLKYEKYVETQSNYDLLTLGVLSVMGYFSHQRFLAVVIALIISVLALHIFKFDKKLTRKTVIQIAVVVLIILLLYLVGVYGKSYYKLMAYKQTTSNIKDHNDYSSIVNRLFSSFNLDGIKNILLSILGKIFYIGIATWGMAYVAVIDSFKYIYRHIINKKLDNRFFILMFINLSFIGSILVAALFMREKPQDGLRFDTLIYGRYSEYLYGVILIIAIDSLLKNYKNFFKLEVYSFIISILLLFVLYPQFINNPNYSVQWLSCSAINEFFYGKNHGLIDSFSTIILRNGIGLMLLVLGLSIRERCLHYYKTLLLILVTCAFIFSSVYTVNNTFFDWKKDVYQQNQLIISIIENENTENEIYCFYGDKYITALQFDMPKTFIHHVENIEEVPVNKLVVSSNLYDGDSRLKLLKKGNYLTIWKVIE